MLQRLFGFDPAQHKMRTEIFAGITTFLTMAYETAVSSGTIMDIQHVIFDDANIITFTPGYYRLHNQPGVSGITLYAMPAVICMT